MKHIDARGLACPEPVVLVQRGIKESPDGLTIAVDQFAAVENIARFAKAHGYAVAAGENGRETTLTLTRA